MSFHQSRRGHQTFLFRSLKENEKYFLLVREKHSSLFGSSGAVIHKIEVIDVALLDGSKFAAVLNEYFIG
jgi:hypothetical protein